MVKKQRKWETIKPGNLVCLAAHTPPAVYNYPVHDNAKDLVTWVRISFTDLLLVLKIHNIPYYEPYATVLAGDHRVEISLNHLELAKKE